MPLFVEMEGGKKKRGCLVWHRRAGKDKTALNFTITQMMKRVGPYYYFFPTFAQGRKIIWDGIDKDGKRYIDHFPKELIAGRPNNTEMKIFLRNGSLFQIVGTDNFDAVVGTNPVGCIFSEYALQNPEAWNYFRPILLENGGWGLFLYTPRGKNHGWHLYEMARKNPNWYCQLLTIKDTKRDDGTPVINEDDIQAERDEGMPEDLIQQEYYCSFERVGGQAFDFSREHHVIKPIPIPHGAPLYMTYDWGYGAPFSVGWWWVDADGRIYRFAEWYGASFSKETGTWVGLRLTDDEVAEGIVRKEKEIGIYGQNIIRLCDPTSFNKKPDYKGGGQGPSTAEVFSRHQIYLSPGDPNRALKIRQFRQRLRVFEAKEGEPTIAPMLQVYDSCEHFIRTIPLIPVSKTNVEDVDTTSEDHAFDESAHICMARPIPLRIPESRRSWYDRRIEELERTKDDEDITQIAAIEQERYLREVQGDIGLGPDDEMGFEDQGERTKSTVPGG